MQKFNLRELAEFGEKPLTPKVLANEPGYRLILMNIRAGHRVPEHTTKERVTIYAVSGHITFYQDGSAVDLKDGEVLSCDANAPHRLEAHADSSLLVVAAGTAAEEEVIDVRRIERFQRHPLIFARFDALGVGESFLLVNDHDPIPLHRQMDTMRPDQLAWEYLQRGPDLFQIRVRRIAPLTGSEAQLSAPPQSVSGIQPAR
jgi:uncharacterized protein (DUF2249 family)